MVELAMDSTDLGQRKKPFRVEKKTDNISCNEKKGQSSRINGNPYFSDTPRKKK